MQGHSGEVRPTPHRGCSHPNVHHTADLVLAAATPGTHAEQVGCKPLGVIHSFLRELLLGQPSKVRLKTPIFIALPAKTTLTPFECHLIGFGQSFLTCSF